MQKIHEEREATGEKWLQSISQFCASFILLSPCSLYHVQQLAVVKPSQALTVLSQIQHQPQ